MTDPVSGGGTLPSGELSDAVPRLPQVGIWEHLLPENRVLISDGFCQLAGIDPERGRDNPAFWSERIHPEDLVRVRADYRAFLEGGVPTFSAQYRVRHEEGRWIWVHAQARWEQRRDTPGQLVRGYVIDVTWSERLKLQAAIIERVNEGVMLVARDGIIQFANPAMEAALGYGNGELTGMDSFQLSFRPREVFDGLLQTVFEATRNGGSALIDLEARRRDGSLLTVQGRFTSLALANATYVVSVFTDTSARRQLEREMMQMVTEMQHRVGGDLHEGLSQLLSGIAMMLHGLKSRAVESGASALGEELEQVVGLLNGAVRKTRLLARGLSPVRASAEGLVEGFEELVNNVHEVYGRRVRLTMDLPRELSVDENSALNLYHIAQEALENAARHAEAGDIQLNFSASGPDLELQVVDDGVGFDPFVVTRYGMGLRMMRFRAEMARGYLSIESRPGQGARLRCRCPAKVDMKA